MVKTLLGCTMSNCFILILIGHLNEITIGVRGVWGWKIINVNLQLNLATWGSNADVVRKHSQTLWKIQVQHLIKINTKLVIQMRQEAKSTTQSKIEWSPEKQRDTEQFFHKLSRVRALSRLPLPSVLSCLFQQFVTGAISTDLAVGLRLSRTASVPPVAH